MKLRQLLRLWKLGKRMTFDNEAFIEETNTNNVQKSPTQYIESIIEIFQSVNQSAGDVVELGVATGRNAYILGRLIQLLAPNKRYIGFDTFSGYTAEDIETSPNADALKRNQNSGRWNYSEELVRDFMCASGLETICDFVVGDLKSTFPRYLEIEPSRQISLLYVDCNAYLPSITAMRTAWPHMTPGSIICIDEHLVGGETQAIKEFSSEIGVELTETGDKIGIPYFLKKI